MSKKSALIMRATGAQGRGTIKHLIGAGWKINALVTDASSDRALALKSFGPGVTLYQGTWRGPASVEAALKGCQALFFNQLPAFADTPKEEASLVLRLAKEAGIRHVVFPTTLPLNNPNIREDLKDSSAAPAVLEKADVEELVKSSGMTWTLLRPGYFMTNLVPPSVYYIFPEIKDQRIIHSFGHDCVLPLVDPGDVGAFVTAALENPSRFASKIITVVGHNMRVDEMIKKVGEAAGTHIEIIHRSPEDTAKNKNNPLVASQLMCMELDKLVDMDDVKSWGLPLTSFEEFVEQNKEKFEQLAKPAQVEHVAAYAVHLKQETV